jgi:predicted alpha/beta hydrolase family esterase
VKKQVLFIQGGGAGAHDEWDNKLVDSLRQELGLDYDVRYPRMPEEADPRYTMWKAVLAEEIAGLEDGAILIGHSVGGTILINAVAETPPNRRLAGIFLIAAPFVGPGGWPSEDIKPTANFGARLPPKTPIYLYHGSKDDTAPFAHVDLYERAIPGAIVHRLRDRDHQLNDDLAEVAAGVRDTTTMSKSSGAPTIRFDATLYTIDNSTILRLPEKASGKLPSRGQVAVHGTINGHEFQTVLEPDGYSGHWMRIDGQLQQTAALSAGDTATLEIETLEGWPEPNVPQDVEKALAAAPQKIQDLWKGITPMARWEWVRWVNATQNPDTRKRRVEVSISKMKSGKRRPCCFNLAACTDPNLSKNSRLIESA